MTLPQTRQFEKAVEVALSFLNTQREVRKPEFWVGVVIVRKSDGRYAVYAADAWDDPVERPLLPWAPPSGGLVARVGLDGAVSAP